MTFQAQLAADLATFLNPGEFGAVRDVDGREVPCVLEENTLDLADMAMEGVYVSEFKLYLRTADVVAVPVITQRMSIAGKQATVVHVDEEMGMLTIRLRWFES